MDLSVAVQLKIKVFHLAQLLTNYTTIIYHDFSRASCIAKYWQHSSIISHIGVHNEVRSPCENLWNVDTSLQLNLSERSNAKFRKKMTLHTGSFCNCDK